MEVTCLLFLSMLSLLPSLIFSQSITTIPSSESQPTYVIGQEEENVSLYCAVLNPDLVITTWQYKRTVDADFTTISFNANDEITTPAFLQNKIEVDGRWFQSTNATHRTNFTLLNFTSEDNLVTFRCGTPNGNNRRFTIGLPGMIIK